MTAQQLPMLDGILARLAATQHAGHTANVRYRQDELHSLHSALLASQSQLRAAISQDFSYLDAEVDVEFAMGLDAVRHHYESLDFDASIVNEYKIAEGKSNPDRQCAVGLVHINCSADSVFFAVIAPLAAAIAAGNVVVLEMYTDTDRGNLAPLLEKTLAQALSSASFAVIHDTPDRSQMEKLGVRYFSLQQEAHSTSNNMNNRTVAIVDRAADIAAAAKHIARARFAFGGRSVHAPDLVLVNEFVKDRFLEAAVSEAIVYEGRARQSPTKGENRQATFSKIASENAASIVSMVSATCILQVTSRSAQILQAKIHRPLLVVLAVSSLEDAISFATGSFNGQGSRRGAYLASYVFATNRAAKYVAESVDAAVAFVNHVPVELLVGPAAAPPTHATSVRYRYHPTMFQLPRPILNTSETPKQLAGTTILDPASRYRFLSQALRPLKPTGQPTRIAYVGFFEQGLLTSVTIAMTPVAIGLGYAIYQGARWAIGLLRT